jgi:hypothetical protein
VTVAGTRSPLHARQAHSAELGSARVDSRSGRDRTPPTVSRQGGQLKLLNLTKRITDLLMITKLLTVFETFEVEQDAIKSYT